MAMNNKNTPSGKSLKMSADDLKEMVKAAVAECLGEEKEDTPPAEETAGEGMDVMSVIEEAVEAAAALAVLGYTQQDIAVAMKGVDVENLPLEEIVRQSLKKMVK